MKTFYLLLLSFVTLSMLAQEDSTSRGATDSIFSESPIGMTVDQFNKKIKLSSKPILIYFTADWCVACKRQQPILEQVKTESGNRAELYSIDMEINPLIAEYFEVYALPTLMVYKDGYQTWNSVGFQTREQLMQQIRIFFPHK